MPVAPAPNSTAPPPGRSMQESERMNGLLAEVRRSLVELDLGLAGDLTMTG